MRVVIIWYNIWVWCVESWGKPQFYVGDGKPSQCRCRSANDKSNFSKFLLKKVQNSNSHCHNWIQHDKCIQISTNKPSINPVVLGLASLVFGRYRQLFNFCMLIVAPGEHWPRKRVWGCAALKTPFSRLSCRSQGSPFQAKESVHKTPFWENLEILASTASIFTQILAHKPPNLEIFSSQAPKFGNFQLTSPQIWKFSAHKPPFSEANVSSQAPHFGNSGRTPLPEKRLSRPPPPPPPPGISS